VKGKVIPPNDKPKRLLEKVSLDKKLKILFLVPSLRAGGSEKVVITILKHLDRNSIEPHLIIADSRDNLFSKDVPSDVKVKGFTFTRARYAMLRIFLHIWFQKPDVVFSTSSHLNLAIAIVRPLLPKSISFFARESSIVSETQRDRRFGWRNWAYKKFYANFDHIVCQTNFMAEDLVKNYDCPRGKVTTIYNPVDIEKIRERGAARETIYGAKREHYSHRSVKKLVSVGRLVEVKGYDILLHALKFCENPSIKLTLVGEGPLLESLNTLARDLGLVSQVDFVGFQSNPYTYISDADVLVLSSRFEGLPNVVLEAFACGTPVIATPFGGSKEIFEGVSGCVVVNDTTPEALGAAIANFVPGPRLHSDAANKYSARTITAQYELLFFS
jgi:glycosyltransferase involved in cell wall biosynthesis